jgi:hypothetical protein
VLLRAYQQLPDRERDTLHPPGDSAVDAVGQADRRDRPLSNSIDPPSEATVPSNGCALAQAPWTHASSKRRTRGPSREATVIGGRARLLSPPNSESGRDRRRSSRGRSSRLGAA